MSGPEVMAAMSLACDTAIALLRETGLATRLVAMQFARAAGLAEDLLSRTYALAMLEYRIVRSKRGSGDPDGDHRPAYRFGQEEGYR